MPPRFDDAPPGLPTVGNPMGPPPQVGPLQSMQQPMLASDATKAQQPFTGSGTPQPYVPHPGQIKPYMGPGGLGPPPLQPPSGSTGQTWNNTQTGSDRITNYRNPQAPPPGLPSGPPMSERGTVARPPLHPRERAGIPPMEQQRPPPRDPSFWAGKAQRPAGMPQPQSYDNTPTRVPPAGLDLSGSAPRPGQDYIKSPGGDWKLRAGLDGTYDQTGVKPWDGTPDGFSNFDPRSLPTYRAPSAQERAGWNIPGQKQRRY
jgi:hypothetical protein